MVILDGWGLSPAWGGNPITMNNPVNMTKFWRDYPHQILQAFALVGGKYGVVGDSRLGHSTISAGRRLIQDYEKISKSIEDKTFFKNQVLKEAFAHARKNNSNVHMVGMFSKTGIHSHLNHLLALLDMSARENFTRIYVDAITDGIDSGQNDGLIFIEEVEQKILRLKLGQFSSVLGRYYAMDRDGDYKKTRKAYDTIVLGKGPDFSDPVSALTSAYKKGIDDFMILPAVCGKPTPIKENDAVIFFNFRPDRAHQLVEVLARPNFRSGFWHPYRPKNLLIVTMTDYGKDLPAGQSPLGGATVKVAFKTEKVTETLPEILAKFGKKQLRIAETEKTAHVTTFFNCGQDIFPSETRKLVKSKNVKKWDLAPEMSAENVGRAVIDAIGAKDFDFILVNFANVDMMAHTGNISAAGLAVKYVDDEVGKIVHAALKTGGTVLITADHGNVEQIVKFNPKQDPENKHTLNPVPFIFITSENQKKKDHSFIAPSANELGKLLKINCSLADIAPTILELMGLPKPEKMSGKSLLRNLE